MKKQKTNLTHDTVPATVGLVKAVRDELRADIRSGEHDLASKIEGVEQRLTSKIDRVMVSVHRTQVLMEEQRGENKIVLDGIKTVIDRQDRMETDFDELRNTVRTISVVTKN